MRGDARARPMLSLPLFRLAGVPSGLLEGRVHFRIERGYCCLVRSRLFFLPGAFARETADLKDKALLLEMAEKGASSRSESIIESHEQPSGASAANAPAAIDLMELAPAQVRCWHRIVTSVPSSHARSKWRLSPGQPSLDARHRATAEGPI